MTCLVTIRRNKDGKTVRFADRLHEATEYMWSEGNFSCDCNRELFFFRELGLNDPDDTICGESAYSVRIATQDGRILYDEL